MSKPFRFGVQSFNAESAEDWTSQVQRAEENTNRKHGDSDELKEVET